MSSGMDCVCNGGHITLQDIIMMPMRRLMEKVTTKEMVQKDTLRLKKWIIGNAICRMNHRPTQVLLYDFVWWGSFETPPRSYHHP